MDLDDLKTELQEIIDEYLNSSKIFLQRHSPTFIHRVSIMSNLSMSASNHKKMMIPIFRIEIQEMKTKWNYYSWERRIWRCIRSDIQAVGDRH